MFTTLFFLPRLSGRSRSRRIPRVRGGRLREALLRGLVNGRERGGRVIGYAVLRSSLINEAAILRGLPTLPFVRNYYFVVLLVCPVMGHSCGLFALSPTLSVNAAFLVMSDLARSLSGKTWRVVRSVIPPLSLAASRTMRAAIVRGREKVGSGNIPAVWCEVGLCTRIMQRAPRLTRRRRFVA